MSGILTPQFAIQIAFMLITAGSIYGAIRADLKNQRRDIDRNSRAISKTHERIDQILIRE